MPIDELLRSGLPVALDDVSPDVEADLAVVLGRVGRRSRRRRTSYTVALVAAAALVAVAQGLGGDDSRGSVEPAAPDDGVRVLHVGRGSADHLAPLESGRYAIPFLGAADSAPWGEVEVPAGWGQDRLLLATGPDLDPRLRRVELVKVAAVSTDPCQGRMVPVQGGVAGTVGALAKQDALRPSEPRPVWIDGHAGQQVRFTVPLGFDVAPCWDGESLRPIGVGGGWVSVFPGWTYRVWVLDVEGDALAVVAAHGPETTPVERAELTDMVEGLHLTDPR